MVDCLQACREITRVKTKGELDDFIINACKEAQNKSDNTRSLRHSTHFHESVCQRAWELSYCYGTKAIERVNKVLKVNPEVTTLKHQSYTDNTVHDLTYDEVHEAFAMLTGMDYGESLLLIY